MEHCLFGFVDIKLKVPSHYKLFILKRNSYFNAKNIELNRMEFRIWLVLTEHDGRFSAKARDCSPSGTQQLSL